MRPVLISIGSLPYVEIDKVIKVTSKYFPELPAWPQLPKRSFLEDMCVQFSEGFPGIIVDKENRKIYVDTKVASVEIDTFYRKFLEQNLEYFRISCEYSQGIYVLHLLYSGRGKIKCQVTGPITFGLSIKSEDNIPIFHHPYFKDTVIQHILMKTLWQLHYFSQIFQTQQGVVPEIIIFIDEPYLAAYGSVFVSLSREDIISAIDEVINGIKKFSNEQNINVKVGVHCCANTDWSIVLDTKPDIISFDAYNFFGNLMLHRDKLKGFIESGGKIAWGMIPTNKDEIEKEEVNSLVERFKSNFEEISEIVDKEFIKEFYISPACGLGSLSEEHAEKALYLLKGLAESLSVSL